MTKAVVQKAVQPPEEKPTGEISRNTIFQMLGNERRRLTINYLKQLEGQGTVRDIAEHVAAWENGIETVEVTYKQRKRVYTSLYQSHLPKLASAGLINYDKNRGTVSLTDKISEVDIYLETVSKNEISWSEFYLGLGGVFMALAIAVFTDTYPFSLIDSRSYIFAMAAVLLASAGYHTLCTRRSRI
ncbi:DUF7344 domain-containing protein [Halalkalirubrum salinum]|uniref:DUF7344 domain-containing protein n=1 Tax=Halalkalirubrum salinum TaxID=2563889 RepID=UPI0010FAE360|nr:hypothetical protein [Halalkalirubrum salinum]